MKSESTQTTGQEVQRCIELQDDSAYGDSWTCAKSVARNDDSHSRYIPRSYPLFGIFQLGTISSCAEWRHLREASAVDPSFAAAADRPSGLARCQYLLQPNFTRDEVFKPDLPLLLDIRPRFRVRFRLLFNARWLWPSSWSARNE